MEKFVTNVQKVKSKFHYYKKSEFHLSVNTAKMESKQTIVTIPQKSYLPIYSYTHFKDMATKKTIPIDSFIHSFINDLK